MAKPTIYISNKVYIPINEVSMPSIKEEYTTRLYDDNACKVCEYRHDRHSMMCDSCPSYLEQIVLWSPKVISGKKYVALPVGDKKNIEHRAKIDFDDFKIVDKRTLAPFDYPIKFTAKLRPVQEELEAAFMRRKYGMIVAPPRTGKSITMLKICLNLGQRTIFMANQYEFLTQIRDHICGNEKEGIPKCTNLPELEKKYGKKLYGFPKTDEDFNNFQFIFMTYQAFISEKNGKDRLRKILHNFGTLAVDEVHKSNSKCFAKTVSAIRTRYRLGCSGTLERKDGKQFIAEAIIGPVSAKTEIGALKPTVYVHHTPLEGRHYQPGKGAWQYCMRYISKHKKRNEMIVERVVKDLKNGHNILILTQFRDHVTVLQQMINEAWGKHICNEFTGGQGKKNLQIRADTLKAAKEGKIRVVVGIRQMMQLGLNVPAWSCLYEVMPISNKPNLKQETSRICTPKEGKRAPIIRMFVDLNQPQSAGCARSSIHHMKEFGYAFAQSEVQQEALLKVLSTGRRKQQIDLDDLIPSRTQKSSNKLFA